MTNKPVNRATLNSKINRQITQQINKTTELIHMIYKTHTGEWMSPSKVHAIVCAITGTDVTLGSVRRAINKLTNQCKLVRSKTASAYMVFEG